jgi:hypothetical protein
LIRSTNQHDFSNKFQTDTTGRERVYNKNRYGKVN